MEAYKNFGVTCGKVMGKGLVHVGSLLNQIPFKADSLFWLDGTISGDEFVDKSGNNRNFTINDNDIELESGFPYKSAATISAPVGDATLIAADINNYLYDSGGTPNQIPVVSLFQDVDYEHKLFCRHIAQVVDGNGVETSEAYVKDIVLYNTVKSDADLTLCQNYYSVDTLDASYIYVTAAQSLQSLSDSKNDGSTLYVKSANPRTLAYNRFDSINKNNYIKSIGYNKINSSDGTHIIRGWGLIKEFSRFFISPALSDVIEFANGTITSFKFNYINENCEGISNALKEVKYCIFNGNYNASSPCLSISAISNNDVEIVSNLFLGALNLNDIKIQTITSGTLLLAHNKFKSSLKDVGTIISIASTTTAPVLIKDNYIRSTKTISVAIDFRGNKNASTQNIECCFNNIYCDFNHYKAIEFLEHQNDTPYVHHNFIEYTYDGTCRPVSFHSGNARIEKNVIRCLGSVSHGDDIDGDVQNSEVLVSSLVHTIKNNSIRSNRDGQTHINIGYTTTDADNKISVEISENKIKGYGTFNETVGNAKAVLVQFQKNAKINYNNIEGASFGIQISGNTSFDSSGVFYNIIKNCGRALYSYNPSVKWVNNTIILEKTGQYGFYCESGMSGNIFKNNIVIMNALGTNYGARESNIGNSEIDYNLYYCPNGELRFQVGAATYTFTEWQALGYDANSIVLTEAQFNGLFTDFANGDYSLKAGSVAIGSGVALDAAYDDGLDASTDWGADDEIPTVVTKQQGASWDIGAYIS